jgi:hypothetical protein
LPCWHPDRLHHTAVCHVKEELARLLDIDPGFAVQNIEQDGKAFRLILSRNTDLSEKLPSREERRRFLS